MGIEEVLIAPKSPWQNPYVERVIGSIGSIPCFLRYKTSPACYE
jgi:hypothetical protein